MFTFTALFLVLLTYNFDAFFNPKNEPHERVKLLRVLTPRMLFNDKLWRQCQPLTSRPTPASEWRSRTSDATLCTGHGNQIYRNTCVHFSGPPVVKKIWVQRRLCSDVDYLG